jgi:nitrile hydratase
MSHDHDHDHDHDLAARAAAIEAILVDKGLLRRDDIARIVEHYETNLGPLNGAKVIARAWTSAAYKKRLFEHATSAIAELGFGGHQAEHLVVVENTPKVHNLVVCTLCSCYPWPVLGLPPSWYKSPAYRARAVKEPRKLIAEFGLVLGDDVEVCVWDSSADIRYMVMPERPQGTDQMGEDELAKLITRDSMIGVARASLP